MTPSPADQGPDPDADAIPGDGRAETETQRLDRNWESILQELRVAQTGTQILTGFLLTLAFQQRFTDLDAVQVDLYLTLVVLAVLTTTLALTPVAVHRALFRRRAMSRLVVLGDRMLRGTLAGVGLVLAGTTLLIFDVVVSLTAGIIAGVVTLAIAIALWLVVPVGLRPREEN